MSRIGKKPILIPEGVEIRTENQNIIVKGPKGELFREIPSEIKIEIKDNQLFVSPKMRVSVANKASQGNAKHSPKVETLKNKQTKALWGLFRALLANMVEGVSKGFEKKLEIQGIGFKAVVIEEEGTGEELILNVGYSHPVKIKIPQDLKISVEKNIIIVSGIDKELVGQIAAKIRKVRPSEPYKGKGIRYIDEIIRRKAGKKATTTT